MVFDQLGIDQICRKYERDCVPTAIQPISFDILSALKDGDSFIFEPHALVWKLWYRHRKRGEPRLTSATPVDDAPPTPSLEGHW